MHQNAKKTPFHAFNIQNSLAACSYLGGNQKTTNYSLRNMFVSFHLILKLYSLVSYIHMILLKEKVLASINPCMEVPLEIAVGICNTFDNNYRIEINFTKYLKETKHEHPFTLKSIPTTFPCLSQVELRYLH